MASKEEQMKELQEKLKKMSPEEIKELQKQQCIFCQIISGKVSSKKFYEDDRCLAILDINPANPGHALLMPKEHYPLMPLIPDDIIAHLAMVSKALSRVMLTAVNAEGTNIFIANGSAAGQRSQHFMLHIIPRRQGDGVPMEIPVKEADEKEIAEIASAIRDKVNVLLNVKKEVVHEKKEQKEDKKEHKQEQPKHQEKKEENKQETQKFITSETAKRYHKSTCAFAQNIAEDKRILMTEKEAKESGKEPCTCITGKRIPLKKEPKTSRSETKKEPRKDSNQGKKEGVDLDDIANLFS